MSMARDLFCFAVPLTMLFLLYCLLPPVLVVVDGPFLIGQFAWILLSSSFQVILLIILQWLMPLNFLLCCILHALEHFTGALLVSVCWIFVLKIKSTCYALCLWLWDTGCIWIYVDIDYTSSLLYYCFWMWRDVILKLSDMFCGIYCWICLYLHQWV